jgi:CrcB protein
MTYLWVAIGGAIGSVARFWAGGVAVAALGEAFPWGTLFVNVLGSLIIGATAALTGPEGRLAVPGDARVFVMVGLCGGFTTFSSFSLQTLGLMQDGAWLRAGANVVASVLLCLIAVWAGHAAASRL